MIHAEGTVFDINFETPKKKTHDKKNENQNLLETIKLL